jgi:hypothetical protein
MATLTVPWIRDRHTHVSLYAALRGCPVLSHLDHDAAVALLRGLPGERLSIVLGWHSGRVSFTAQELDELPPALLVKHSLHGLALTTSGRRMLRDRDPELVERWREANNPFRMLIDRCGFRPGEDLVFGSDGMPHGIEFALQWSLFPRYEAQRMEVDEVLAGYGTAPGVAGSSALDIDGARRQVRLVAA